MCQFGIGSCLFRLMVISNRIYEALRQRPMLGQLCANLGVTDTECVTLHCNEVSTIDLYPLVKKWIRWGNILIQ